ncbi:hypothetical protein Egran_05927 [Elaphomyces granulatus]|uniref:C2H2-type domain-containing protein n=1 Tax=Elaphomyces granulatus TaxID=519963 RepID=A0A232LQD4_9EURO|nr:hypothetical protein Egran_05927 [Elaphomyces granulatus]
MSPKKLKNLRAHSSQPRRNRSSALTGLPDSSSRIPLASRVGRAIGLVAPERQSPRQLPSGSGEPDSHSQQNRTGIGSDIATVGQESSSLSTFDGGSNLQSLSFPVVSTPSRSSIAPFTANFTHQLHQVPPQLPRSFDLMTLSHPLDLSREAYHSKPMDSNYHHSTPSLPSQDFHGSIESLAQYRPFLSPSNTPNMLPQNSRQQTEFFPQSQWSEFENPTQRADSVEQLPHRGEQVALSPFPASAPVSFPSSQSPLFPGEPFPMRINNPSNQSYYPHMTTYNLGQPGYDLNQATFVTSTLYPHPAAPDSRVPVTASPYLPSSSIRGSPEPESQVRVIESRPKPQCWDHGCNGREFSTFSNLLRHQRERSGAAAKSECPHCGAIFTRTTARNTHIAQGKCKGGKEPAD